MGADEIKSIGSRIQMQKLGEGIAGKIGRLKIMDLTRKNKTILSEVPDFVLIILL